ncbi:DUF1801 domain-containing protein [Acholeplasma equirhinis]|uniref:iron chaperone n=1 Tax=Acholeplasma equirhinis TaxID=555393 RepID=UPI00197B0279|nr:DUF1801 domain-containing protein [Acholeplasma equirhinis]MBN3490261.1 DUF1801 domain-containing protein [Acholeplasma equirhinis]
MGYIENFDQYVNLIKEDYKKHAFLEVINFIKNEYPELKLEMKWNQPMFIHQGTFILAVSTLKNHMSIAPELKAMTYFRDEIIMAGYEETSQLFRIKYKEPVNYTLLKRIIDFNIKDKMGYDKFWRA